MPMTRILWVVFIVAIVVLGERLSNNLLRDAGVLTVSRDNSAPGTVVLAWNGPIEHPMAAQIEEAYLTHGAEARRFVVVLNSQGGLVRHGSRVISLLERMKATHRVDTAVEGWRKCASMCVPVFLAGQTRYASRGSRWLFHEVTIRDAISDEQQDLSLRERRALTDNFFDRFFRPVGVSEAWIRSIRSEVEAGDVWRTGAELVAEGSGIVTDLI